ERFVVGEDVPAERMKAVLERALDLGNDSILIYRDDTGDEEDWVKGYHLPGGMQIPKPEPRLFSFNSPLGACPDCTGLGIKLVLEADLVMPNKRLTIAEGAIKPWTRISGNQSFHFDLIEKVGKKHGLSLHKPIESFTAKQLST